MALKGPIFRLLILFNPDIRFPLLREEHEIHPPAWDAEREGGTMILLRMSKASIVLKSMPFERRVAEVRPK
jgi:hypothetical protein